MASLTTSAGDRFLKSYPTSGFALQITQPNWVPSTPMQEVYLKHVKECKEKFDMTNYNNHDYWLRVGLRRQGFNGTFTRLNDGVLPQGPKLLLFASFALPVTLFVDILPFCRGWIKRLHNSFHGGKYQRVVDIPKFAFYNTATVNRMGVLWCVSRFVCRMFQLTREQSYLICSWITLYATLPVFYRMARIGIPTAYCIGSYLTYKYIQHRGGINVLGIRRGRRSRELFARSTTRFRMRTAQERLVNGNSAGILSKFFHFHSRRAKRNRRKRRSNHRRRRIISASSRWGTRFIKRRKRKKNKTLPFWNWRREQYDDSKFNTYPEWYYGQYGNRPNVDWDVAHPNTRDRAYRAMEGLRNDESINFVQPRAYDIRKRELESSHILDEYLDGRLWADPNIAVHGQAQHVFEHYLEKADNFFF